MSFWKLLSGAASGVTTAIGQMTSSGDNSTIGDKTAAVIKLPTSGQFIGKTAQLAAAFEHAEQQIAETSVYFDLLIAVAAVGLSCAACDGEIASEESQEIDDFIRSVDSSELPLHIKEKIEGIAKNPPDINTAFALTQKIGLDSYQLFTYVIEVVTQADGIVHAQEKQFKQCWDELVAASKI